MQYLAGFADKLIKWYDLNKRDLPWRHTNDPYKIWISEIIMQQTRVQQGLPYYENFTKTFPNVKDLADASLDQVLRLWQGLGYYSRARNMHEAAKEVTYNLNERFPGSFVDLIKLKGVGRYTAAAIASFAFGEKVPVVDGNVMRVISRVFGIEEDISLPPVIKKIENIAKDHISNQYPGIFNQAIMEFGALYCIPGKPDCENCIFRDSCFAFNNNMVFKLPLKINKVKVKQRYFNYILFKHGSLTALKQRTKKDIWMGLHEYYLIETEKLPEPHELREILIPVINEPILFEEISEIHVHILTHQKIYARFYTCITTNKNEIENLGFKFYSDVEIEELAKPVLILKNIKREFFL